MSTAKELIGMAEDTLRGVKVHTQAASDKKKVVMAYIEQALEQLALEETSRTRTVEGDTKTGTAKELVEEMLSHIKPYGTCGEHVFVNATTGQFNNWLKQALALLAVEKKCEWKYDDCHNMYDTQCGKAWCFLEGTAIDNDCKYCPCCGGEIKQALKPSKGGEG